MAEGSAPIFLVITLHRMKGRVVRIRGALRSALMFPDFGQVFLFFGQNRRPLFLNKKFLKVAGAEGSVFDRLKRIPIQLFTRPLLTREWEGTEETNGNFIRKCAMLHLGKTYVPENTVRAFGQRKVQNANPPHF